MHAINQSKPISERVGLRVSKMAPPPFFQCHVRQHEHLLSDETELAVIILLQAP